VNDVVQQHAALLPLIFAVGFVALWVVLSYVTSFLAGWWGLAQRYRTEKPCPDHKRRMQTGVLRGAFRYNHVMTVGSDAEGIYVSLPFIFRLGCPSLFVPWADVEIEAPTQLFLFMMQTLRLGPDRTRLRLRQSLVDFLKEGKDPYRVGM
jgi:hypothetical protein